MAGAKTAPLHFVFSGTVPAPAAAISVPGFRAPERDAFLGSLRAAAFRSFDRSTARRPALKANPWQPLVVAVGGLLEAPRDVRTVVLSVGCGPVRGTRILGATFVAAAGAAPSLHQLAVTGRRPFVERG